MKSKVIITANPTTGSVFTPNAEVSKKDGKQYGFIRLEQTIVDLCNPLGGVKKISALKSFSAEEFGKAKDFLLNGTKLDGNIVRLESTEKKQGYSPKMAGDTGVQCSINGMPIFQTTVYDQTGELADELIAHDNKEAIKAAQAAKVGAGALNS